MTTDRRHWVDEPYRGCIGQAARVLKSHASRLGQGNVNGVVQRVTEGANLRAAQAMMSLTTRPWTSVSLKSRPLYR